MPVYLNTVQPLEKYRALYRSKYFVDKSMIIEGLNEVITTSDRYVCITRPRRFGKSSVVDMLGSYYSKGVMAEEIFDTLKISQSSSYKEHLNQYNVLTISFNKLSDKGMTYRHYIGGIKETLINDIVEAYPDINPEKYSAISDMLNATNEKFVVIIDEWDYIFTNNLFEEHQNEFLEFLRNLLKDQAYIALCYMTGVLPIKKYSSGSSLNMFDEFTMLSDMLYAEFFGFTEEEVRALCEKQDRISFDELSEWYNGYLTEEGIKIYNPRSVVKALQSHRCRSYWTNTGAMNEVAEHLKYNVLEIRDDVIKMVARETIDMTITEEFRAGQGQPKTKKEVYSAMIILGFLSYFDGYLRIPNKEIMQEFEKALEDESFGYVSQIIEKSKAMLKATINGETQVVENILHEVHNCEIPILKYNDENSLACVMTLAYLSARDTYRIEREEKSGKGYVDFAFYPRRKSDVAFIVELKKDEAPEIALKQIREKEYVEKFKREYNGQKILAVAICYDSKEKEHQCKIEELQ